MPRWNDFDYFPPSTPRVAKGGIRAQTKQGAFASTWWARRWMAVLEGFGIGSRLQRGRRYARQGQVLGIDIAPGRIQARVQGSRATPYEVTIQVAVLEPEAWAQVASAAAAQALFASKLLAGEMPPEMEQLFEAAGTSLFPGDYQDLDTQCSCPDWSNPCKHIAAVYYLLGEEFDRDPFLVFRMRGITREGFLELLGGSTSNLSAAPLPEPLPADPAAFWNAAPFPPRVPPEVRLTEAALPRRLGAFPFWRGATGLREFLDAVYVRASAHTAELFLDVRSASRD